MGYAPKNKSHIVTIFLTWRKFKIGASTDGSWAKMLTIVTFM